MFVCFLWELDVFGFQKKKDANLKAAAQHAAGRRLRLHVESDRKQTGPSSTRRPPTSHLHALLQFLIQQVDRCCCCHCATAAAGGLAPPAHRRWRASHEESHHQSTTAATGLDGARWS
jgi:hypothetical protein